MAFAKSAWMSIALCAALLGCAAQPVTTGPDGPATHAPSVAPVLPQSQLGIGKVTLGMPLEAAMAVFDEPGRSGSDASGNITHAYSVSGGLGDMTLISAPFRPGYIYGVIIEGGAGVEMAPVAGIRLGDSAYTLMTQVGEPTSREAEADNRTRWNYETRNYAFDVATSGEVVAIRVYGYTGVMTALGYSASWDQYPPNSLAAVIEAERAAWQSQDTVLAAGGVALRPRVIFTGDTRPTSQEELALIQSWASTLPGGVAVASYGRSVRVLENDAEFWLPVQEEVLKELQTEAKPGEAVDLFVMWLGASHFGANKALIVNQFCTCSWAAR